MQSSDVRYRVMPRNALPSVPKSRDTTYKLNFAFDIFLRRFEGSFFPKISWIIRFASGQNYLHRKTFPRSIYQFSPLLGERGWRRLMRKINSRHVTAVVMVRKRTQFILQLEALSVQQSIKRNLSLKREDAAISTFLIADIFCIGENIPSTVLIGSRW